MHGRVPGAQGSPKWPPKPGFVRSGPKLGLKSRTCTTTTGAGIGQQQHFKTRVRVRAARLKVVANGAYVNSPPPPFPISCALMKRAGTGRVYKKTGFFYGGGYKKKLKRF